LQGTRHSGRAVGQAFTPYVEGSPRNFIRKLYGEAPTTNTGGEKTPAENSDTPVQRGRLPSTPPANQISFAGGVVIPTLKYMRWTKKARQSYLVIVLPARQAPSGGRKPEPIKEERRSDEFRKKSPRKGSTLEPFSGKESIKKKSRGG